jgi:magnesium transporter
MLAEAFGGDMTGSEDESPSPVAFETAGEHVARHVPMTTPDTTAGEVRAALTGRHYACATDVAVCADGRLIGLLPIEALLAARADAPVRSIMDPDPPVVRPGADQELAAWKAVQQGESALAVVDEAGGFVGLIPPQRLLAVLLAEHHEDMARLGGMWRNALSARRSLQEPIGRRLVHRLPWLVVGLLGMLLAADVVALFERELQSSLVLAFFLPGLVYLADAVSTQTETLVVRGLSVGIPISRVLRQEMVTGVLIGFGLALAAIVVTVGRWGVGEFVAVLAISLALACTAATAVAIGLPWLLQRVGQDPAFASGPLGTVIQDLLSILIYFAVARVVMA